MQLWGSLHQTCGHMCACACSRVCKGLEIFLGGILYGLMAMLLSGNEHMAAGSREGRLREEGLHPASQGAATPALGLLATWRSVCSYNSSHINPPAGTWGCMVDSSTYFPTNPRLRNGSQHQGWVTHSDLTEAGSAWRVKLFHGSLSSRALPLAAGLGSVLTELGSPKRSWSPKCNITPFRRL